MRPSRAIDGGVPEPMSWLGMPCNYFPSQSQRQASMESHLSTSLRQRGAYAQRHVCPTGQNGSGYL